MTEEQDRLFREYLRKEHQDDLSYLTPSGPSALAELTNVEVQRLYRKIAFANRHPWDRQVELELIGRFTVALKGFKDASDKASKQLAMLTWVLVALTVVIAGFTVAFFFSG